MTVPQTRSLLPNRRAQRTTGRASAGSPSRRAAWAGGVGTVIEYYDYSLYGFLAVTIAPLFFPSSDPTASLMAGLLLFATGFLLRPLGGLLFGWIGDVCGRRTALLATLLSMGLASAAIGLVPTYESAGVWATMLLVVFRILQGLSAGGELGGSMTFIAESTGSSHRGALGAATTIGITIGFAAAGTVVGVFSLVLTDDQFASWGWRVPFILSLPLCLFCLWLRSRAEETLDRSEPRRGRGSLGRLVRQDSGSLAVTTLASVAVNATSYIGLGYLSVHLIKVLEMPATAAYWIAVCAIFFSGGAAFYSGRLADRYGLMRVTTTSMIAFGIIAVPAFALMSTGSPLAALVAYMALIGLAMAAAAPVLASVPLIFHRHHRYTGVAMGWNLGAIAAGATTPLVAFWLVEHFDSSIAPAIVCMLGAVLGVIAALLIGGRLRERGHA